jgi:phage FluMu protein Com
MKAATVSHKPITCPNCKTEQRLHLLAVPDKPTVLIPKQTVRCVECEQSFYLLNDARIVDGPFAV